MFAYVISGYKVLTRSVKNILRGNLFDENFLMALATFGAIAIHQYPEAVAVMIFYEIGEYFQDLAVNQSKNAIQALIDIKPEVAHVLKGGIWVDATPESIALGDTVLVKPGERIPLDGVVSSGHGSVDQSALTGESAPIPIAVGASVLSGSIVLNGLIQINVTSTYAHSTVARILDLVENATAHKAPTENFITKFARYYTPVVVLAAAALAFIPPFLLHMGSFSDWLYRGLIFLVISCPCALVISVPLGFFSGIGNASNRGILIKGSNYLEALNTIDTVVFDKTGTLTEGHFEVHEAYTEPGVSREELLSLTALAEHYSNHPIAKSIVRYAGIHPKLEDNLGYEEIVGQGILMLTPKGKLLVGNRKLMHARGIDITPIDSPYTVIYVALGARYLGAFDVRDTIKPDAASAIEKLKAMGLKTTMLTGDHHAVAEDVAHRLNLDSFYSELLPEDKYNLVRTEIDAGDRVAFVGDGINDAPVLAGATVGISMGSIGSDAAIEASDVVLMTDEPEKLVEAIAIARQTKRIVLQNIFFAIGVKVLVMALGTFGLASMWMAIFADVGVALIAVLNAVRILRFNPN
jgi:Cd2+/Zn2+-exporting ATPase